ncbi:MAG: spermidine synthase, partial [Nitrospinales bacterium]
MAFLVIVGPAFFMGGTLPVIAAVLIERADDMTSKGGLIYGANVMGAACGALAGGMILPALIGAPKTFYAAALVNCGNFVFVYSLSRKAKAPASTFNALQRKRGRTEKPVNSPSAERGGPLNFYLGAVAFVSGFSMLTLEVLWNRMFAQVFQNSVYTFSAVVVVFLMALGAGSFLAAALDRRGWNRNAALSVLLLSTGAVCYATPFLFVEWTGLGFYAADSSWMDYMRKAFGLVLGIIFLPAALGGMILPLVWQLYDRAGIGRRVGVMNAANTLGTVTGALAAGFLMVPWLGVWRSIALVSMVYLVFADFSLGNLERKNLRKVLQYAVYVLILSVMIFNPATLTVQKLKPGERLAFLKEGSGATVAVIDKNTGRAMKLNNHYTLGGVNAMVIERMQAQIPLLLHANPQSAVFIGLATGITAGAAVPFDLEEIHVAEIIPEVVEAARLFDDFNNGLLDRENVRIHREDGRNFILGVDQTFDVIVSDLFVPNHAGTGYLYSKEHFANVAGKLKPGGIFCQWLSAYELSLTDFKTIAATFQSEFPVNSVWLGDFSLKKPLIGLIG